MIKNPNFANGGGGVSQRYLYNDGQIEGPTGETYDNIKPPNEWIFFWLEGQPGPGDPQWLTARPETHPIFRQTFPDFRRFLTDYPYSLQAFTFWKNHNMGLGQTIAVIPGQSYSWSLFAHAWYSSCSDRPHDPPIERDCVTGLDWADIEVSMGIDVLGGQSPWSEGVIWGPWENISYGGFSDWALLSPIVRAGAPYITLWFQSRTTHPLKHCDIYLSHATLIKESEPVPDCTLARVPYDRTVNVYKPELGRDRYLEICAEVWDDYGPQTVGPSTDDAFVGDGLESKTARFWDLHESEIPAYQEFAQLYYPGADVTMIFHEPFPDDPPPLPIGEGEILSLHVQTEVEGIREYIKDLADCGNYLRWIKLVKGFEFSETIKVLSPKTKVLAREIWNYPGPGNPEHQAKAFLDTFWDAIARNQNIHAVESTNELFGTSNTVQEIQDRVALEIAISNEIKRRSDILKAEQGREVIGVLLNVPIGNLQHGDQTTLLQPVIDTALANGHACSYHPYFPITPNAETSRRWMEEEGYHHHLRLQLSWAQSLDGLDELPIFYTEGGGIATTVRADGRPGQYLAHDGWRSPNGLNGNLDLYLELLLRCRYLFLNSPLAANIQTVSIFTTGDPGVTNWGEFIVGTDEFPALGSALC